MRKGNQNYMRDKNTLKFILKHYSFYKDKKSHFQLKILRIVPKAIPHTHQFAYMVMKFTVANVAYAFPLLYNHLRYEKNLPTSTKK